MKKSKKLILGTIAAMGVLAIGTGAVSTFAWFSADAAAQGYATKQSSDNISAVTSSATLGSFTVTPVVKTLGTGVSLTTDTGTSNIYVGDDTATEVPATPAKKHESVVVKLKVTYSGSLDSAAKINAAWQDAARAVTVAISDETADAPSGGGLKFFASEPSGTSYAGTSVSLSFTAADLQGATFTYSGNPASANEPETSTSKTFYYGIKGVDGTTDDADATYVIGLLASAA